MLNPDGSFNKTLTVIDPVTEQWQKIGDKPATTATAVEKESTQPVQETPSNVDTATPVAADIKPVSLPKKQGRPRSTTDRKAYMKELMRKKRAQAKAVKI